MWAGSTASAADIAYPTLVSFEVQSLDAAPDEPVTISYEASSETPLRSATFNFVHEGRTYSARTAAIPAALAGTVQLVLPDGAKNGTWQLTSISLVTGALAESRDPRVGGTVGHGPVTPSQPHDFDLAASDVVLSGSNEDLAHPVLSSLTASTGTFTPGQDVTVDYVLEDQTGLALIFVVLTEPRTGRNVTAYRPLSTACPFGSIVVRLDNSVANGPYAVDSVAVRDVMGNQATYRSGGTITTPSGDQVIGHHNPRFADGLRGDRVDGGLRPAGADHVHRRGPDGGHRPAGDGVVRLLGQRATLASLTAVWQIDGEGQISLTSTNVPTSGSLSVPTSAEGVARLSFIAVNDGANFAVYHRDGTLVNGSYPNPRHAVDLTTGDLTIGNVPGAPAVTAVPGNSTATVELEREAAAHASAVTAYKVTASPGGQTETLAGR